ncbi:MAG: CRISPR-associated protein Csx19 [Acidobacteriota bacterium]
MNLYGRANNNIGLMEAVMHCGDLLFQSPVIALLYTPDWCGFAQLEQAGSEIEMILSARDERRFDLASVFEARVFNEQVELRWLKQWPNKGRAALISAEADISKYLDYEAGTFVGVDHIDQTYLLWGEGARAKKGELPANWSRLAMARIGTLDMPYPLDASRSAVSQSGERIQLVAREYLDADVYGNVAVIEERLLGLAPAISAPLKNTLALDEEANNG